MAARFVSTVCRCVPRVQAVGIRPGLQRRQGMEQRFPRRAVLWSMLWVASVGSRAPGCPATTVPSAPPVPPAPPALVRSTMEPNRERPLNENQRGPQRPRRRSARAIRQVLPVRARKRSADSLGRDGWRRSRDHSVSPRFTRRVLSRSSPHQRSAMTCRRRLGRRHQLLRLRLMFGRDWPMKAVTAIHELPETRETCR